MGLLAALAPSIVVLATRPTTPELASAAVGIYNNTTTGELFYNPTFGVAGDSIVFAVVNVAAVAGGSAALSAEEFTLV